MSIGQEGYKPTPEDYQKAEEMMTREEKEASHSREIDRMEDQTVERLLESGIFPPKQMVPADEIFSIKTSEDVSALEQRLSEAYQKEDFTQFPAFINIETEEDREQIIALIKRLREGVASKESEDKEGVQSPLAYIVAATKNPSIDDEYQIAGADAITGEHLDRPLPTTIFITGGHIPLVGILRGEPEVLRRFIDMGRWDCRDLVSVLSRRGKFDGIMFAARSALHWGYLINGFFDQIKKEAKTNGADVDPPYCFGLWHKMRYLLSHRTGAANVILSDFKNAEEIHSKPDEEIDRYLEAIGWYTEERGTIGNRGEEVRKFKEETAPHLFDALSLAEKQLKQIIASKKKKNLVIAYFDESRDTGTTSAMMHILMAQALARVRQSDPSVNIEFEELGKVTTGVLGSYPSWEKEKIGKYQEKIVRPRHRGSFNHTVNRVLMALDREAGAFAAQIMDPEEKQKIIGLYTKGL